MAIKKYNPTTPARRGMTTEDYSEITTRKSKMLDATTLVELQFDTEVVVLNDITES